MSLLTTPVKRQNAFTLIELLVVIAIIAILAAILFPVFAQAKAAAKKTQCLSNSKQIATGLYIYLNDFDDTLPDRQYNKLLPYAGGKSTVFLCPSDQYPTKVRDDTDSDFFISYNSNRAVLVNIGFVPHTATEFDQVSGTIVYADRRTDGTGDQKVPVNIGVTCYLNGARMTEAQAVNKTMSCAGRVQTDRHTGGFNVIYMDNHAKWTKMEKTITPDFQWGPETFTSTKL